MTIITEADKEAIRKARETVKRHSFSGDDYQSIEARKQAEVDTQRLRACEESLNDAYECFMGRGERYEQ